VRGTVRRLPKPTPFCETLMIRLCEQWRRNEFESGGHSFNLYAFGLLKARQKECVKPDLSKKHQTSSEAEIKGFGVVITMMSHGRAINKMIEIRVPPIKMIVNAIAQMRSRTAAASIQSFFVSSSLSSSWLFSSSW